MIYVDRLIIEGNLGSKTFVDNLLVYEIIRSGRSFGRILNCTAKSSIRVIGSPITVINDVLMFARVSSAL